jgi:hypothetical protein
MENVFRAILTGIIFHLAAGSITAGLWRLTYAHKLEVKSQNHNNPKSDFGDLFSEVMIWPLYLVILFFLLVKSLADLIIYAANKIRKRRMIMKKENSKIRRNKESIYDKIFEEEHMLSGEAEASYLMRHPELIKKKPPTLKQTSDKKPSFL